MSGPTVSDRIDRFSEATGRLTSWLTLAMILLTCVVVVMRYVFAAGEIWLQESVVWMHAAVFMAGAAYTLRHEEHVRVDVFYRRMSPVSRAWIDLVGVVVLLLPVCAFLFWKSFDFVAASWAIREASREPGGLPYPFVPLLKTVLLLMPATVLLQGLSLSLNALKTIRGR